MAGRLSLRTLTSKVFSGGVFFSLLLVLNGCSPSLFTGDKKNDVNISDGKFRPECLGMDLSGIGMTGTTARQLVHCLNSNGSIKEYATLVDSLSSSQLDAVLSVLNEDILTNPALVGQMERSYQHMENAGLLSANLQRVAQILDNKDFVQSALSSLKQTVYSTSAQTEASSATSAEYFKLDHIDDDLMTSFEILSTELTRENISRALEFGITNTQLSSYKGMVTGLKLASRLPLKKVTTGLLRYLKRKISAENHALGKTIFWGIHDGTLFTGLDHFFFSSSAKGKKLDLQYQVQSLDELIRFLAEHKLTEDSTEPQGYLKQLSTLLSVMNAPVRCLEGTKIIPNADMMVFNELLEMDPLDSPQWIVGGNMLKVQLASGACQFPSAPGKNLNELLKSLQELADYKNSDGTRGHNMMVTVAHLVRGMKIGDDQPIGGNDSSLRSIIRNDLGSFIPREEEGERYRKFLIGLLGDTDLPEYLGPAAEEIARKDRGFLGNLLLFINSQDIQDRESLKYALGVVLKPRPQLEGKSIYDVLSKLILRINEEQFHNVLTSLTPFIENDEQYVTPLLQASRDGLLINGANPTLELVQKILSRSKKHKKLFHTLFEIAEKPAFIDAVKLTVKMARNGNLKELLQGSLSMFTYSNRNLNLSSTSVSPPKKPSSPYTAIDYRESTPWKPYEPTWENGIEVCRNLDVTVNLNEPEADPVRWQNTIKNIALCTARGRVEDPFVRLVDFGFGISLSNGRGFIPFTFGTLGSFLKPPSQEDPLFRESLSQLGDLIVSDEKFENLLKGIDALPFLLGRQYENGILGRDFLRLATKLGQKIRGNPELRESAQKILNSVAAIINDEKLPAVVNTLANTYKEAQENPPELFVFPPPIESYPLTNYPNNKKIKEELRLAIREKNPPADGNIDRAVQNRIDTFWYQINVGRERRSFLDTKDFKSSLKPVLDKLAKPAYLESVLGFNLTISKHYSPEWISSWIERLSSNLEVIEYYYPGQYPGKDRPTVRLVSELDLLELIVFDADFIPNEYGQLSFNFRGSWYFNSDEDFAIKFLSLLGQMKRDENMQTWIDTIKYSLSDYTWLMGVPLLHNIIKDEVKRRIANLNWSIRVLEKLNRDVTIGGVTANDLGFLRDTFRALLDATPRHKWNVYDRENSLAIIGDVVRLGFVRFLGTNTWRFDPKTNRVFALPLQEVLRGVLAGGIFTLGEHHIVSPDALTLTRYLVREDCEKQASQNCTDVQDFNKRYRIIGKIVDQLARVVQDGNYSNLKQSGYELGQILGKIQTLDPKFMRRVMTALRHITLEAEEFVLQSLDPLHEFVGNPQLMHTLVTLNRLPSIGVDGEQAYQRNLQFVADASKVLSSAQAFPALAQILSQTTDLIADVRHLGQVTQAMRKDPDWINLNLENRTQEFTDWIQTDSALRRRLLQHLSTSLTGGDAVLLFEGLGEAASQDKLYEHLRFLVEQERRESLKGFLRRARAGLVNP